MSGEITWTQHIVTPSPEYGGLVARVPSSRARDGVTAVDDDGKEYDVQARSYVAADGTNVPAAVFPALPPGNYYVRFALKALGQKATVFPAAIVELDLYD